MTDLPATAAYEDWAKCPASDDTVVYAIAKADAMRDELLGALENAEGMLVEVSEVCEKAETEAERLRKKNEYLASKRLEDYLAHRDEVERLRDEIRRCYAALHEEFGNWPPDAAEDFIARRYDAAHPDAEERVPYADYDPDAEGGT